MQRSLINFINKIHRLKENRCEVSNYENLRDCVIAEQDLVSTKGSTLKAVIDARGIIIPKSEEWDQFRSIVQSEGKPRQGEKRRTADKHLATVAALWSYDVVQHYGWEKAPMKDLAELNKCAIALPDFHDFVPLANWVLAVRQCRSLIESGLQNVGERPHGSHHKSTLTCPLIRKDLRHLAMSIKAGKLSAYGSSSTIPPAEDVVVPWISNTDGNIPVGKGQVLRQIRPNHFHLFLLQKDQRGLLIPRIPTAGELPIDLPLTPPLERPNTASGDSDADAREEPDESAALLSAVSARPSSSLARPLRSSQTRSDLESRVSSPVPSLPPPSSDPDSETRSQSDPGSDSDTGPEPDSDSDTGPDSDTRPDSDKGSDSGPESNLDPHTDSPDTRLSASDLNTQPSLDTHAASSLLSDARPTTSSQSVLPSPAASLLSSSVSQAVFLGACEGLQTVLPPPRNPSYSCDARPTEDPQPPASTPATALVAPALSARASAISSDSTASSSGAVFPSAVIISDPRPSGHLWTIEQQTHNKYCEVVQQYAARLESEASESPQHLRRASWLTSATQYAKMWAPKDSPFGRGAASSEDESDVLQFTSEEFLKVAEEGTNFSRPVLIKEKFRDSGMNTVSRFTKRLRNVYFDSEIDVRRLGSEAPERTPIDHFVDVLNGSAHGGYNALNIRDITRADPPHFTLLDRFSLLHTLSERSKGGVGKEVESRPIDVSSCLSFAILGQEGAFSGAHVDSLAGTYVRNLEGLKFWMIVSEHYLEEMKEDGDKWTPKGKERLVVLEKDDILLMPPGLRIIHAVHTPRTCLMSGGMLWDDLNVLPILESLCWIGRNQNATNEAIAYQLPDIINCLQGLVESEPARFAGAVPVPEFVQEFQRCLAEWRSLSCNCANVSTASCPCRDAGRRCTPGCATHPKTAPSRKRKMFCCMAEEGERVAVGKGSKQRCR